jgi:hypothetical protein
MKLSEKELEDIVFKSSNQALQEKGLEIFGRKIRQLKIGNYGIADIVAFSRAVEEIEGNTTSILDIDIIELKQDIVNIQTFLQSIKYVKGITEYLYKRHFFKFRINITLIGTSVDMSNFIYLPDLIRLNNECYDLYGRLNFYKVSYDVNGINFKNISGYKLIDSGFKDKLI